jgi:hypothetical protein
MNTTTTSTLDAPEATTQSAADASRARRLVAMHLQEIEGNPLNAQDVEMFEMFEREGWTHERRLAHILADAHQPSAG